MKPIWIVDDDQSIRFVLEKALAREDLAVRSFTNPRDVLLALADGAPQVLVSDIRMPGGSGIDLLSKVKFFTFTVFSPTCVVNNSPSIPMKSPKSNSFLNTSL